MVRTMGKYDTAESVWLAAASLAYECFLESDGNVCLRQEIQNK